MNNGRLQFFNLVKQMREAQKEYFKTRSAQALDTSRRLEREVDKYIKTGDDYLNLQTKLFENEN